MSSHTLPAKAEHLFRYLFERASLGIAVEDLDGKILRANPALCSMLGHSENELLAVSCSQFARPEDSADDWALFQQLRAGVIDKYSLEKRYVRKDGVELWGSLNVSLLRNSDEGSAPLVFAFVEDITERKLSEDRLREYENAVEGSEEMITVVDREYRYLIANRKFLKNRNMTKEQVIGHLVPEVLESGVFEAVVKQKLDECFAGKVVKYEMRYTYPDLGERDLFISYFPIEGAAGIDRAACILQDITERRRAEEELRQREMELTEVQRLAGLGSWQWDARTENVTWSEELYRLVGRDPKLTAPSLKEHSSLFTAESWERLQAVVKEALQTGTPYQLDMGILNPGSTTKWAIARGEALRSADGQIFGLRGTVQDITERKQAEVALLEGEQLLRLAMQAGRMYAFEWNLITDVIVRSKESVHILNWTDPEHDTGRDFHARVHPDDRALFVTTEARLTPEKPTYQISFRTLGRDGRVMWLEDIGRASFDTQGKMVRMIGMVTDITERKRAEQALRESEEKLRLLLDSTAEAIYGIDLEHRCTFCNPACLRFLGYQHTDEVVGKNMHELIHHTRANGTPYPQEKCRIHRVTQTGEGIHAEDEVLWRANGTSFPVEYWSYPQRRGNEIIGAVVTFVDISERKLSEAALANVSRKLIEVQEQERTRIGRELHDDIGQRLGLLAVEFQQLRDSLKSSTVRSRMDELQKQISAIAADVQTLSHELHSAKLQYLGISGAVRGFCREFGEQQKVTVDVGTHDLPTPLSADISLCLFRVLQEALHNSAKHSGVRHFEVRLWGTPDAIHLTVKDSGAGFDRELAKLGQGLGLISMEERLKLVNGTLSIDSQPKRGTTIEARVPVRASDSMRAAS